MTVAVRARAGDRCEYCRMHQSLQGATFHVEHVVPSSKGGPSSPDNLAWCCPSCNLSKSDWTEAADPESGRPAPLYHPRQQLWADQFDWHGYRIVGRTPTSRATVAALRLNADRRLQIRPAEERFGLFPPTP